MPDEYSPPGANQGEDAGLRPPLAGADPPIIGDEAPEDQPNPDPDAGSPLPAEPAPRRELPRLQQPARGQRTLRKVEPPPPPLTAEQRLLLLDTWRRSGLPAGDFAPLVGLSKHTLYAWKQRFEAEGPAGLADKPKGLPEEQAAAKRPRGRPRKGGAC